MAYDLIVVGDGVAGLSAAIFANMIGLDCAVVSLHHKVLPQRLLAIHPGVEIIFKELGIVPILQTPDVLRPEGTISLIEGREVFHPYGEDENGHWRGYLLSHKTLLNTLKQRLDQLGIDTYMTKRLDILKTEENRVVGVKVDSCDLEANLIIDSSGPRHLMARSLGLKNLTGSPKLIAITEWDHEEEKLQIPIFHAVKDGWSWSANIPGVGCSTINLSLLPAKKNIAKFSGIKNDVTWKYLPECAGEGYAVIGDAALQLDPATGNGVIRAFMMAAQAIKLFSEPNLVDGYKSWVKSLALHDGKELATRYAGPPFNVSWARKHQWI